MAAIHSFLLEVCDHHGTLLDSFLAPIEGAGLFANRLFPLLPGTNPATLHEPWYRLVPRRGDTGPLTVPTVQPPPLSLPPGIAVPELVPDPADPVRAITVSLYDLERALYSADYSTVEVFGALLRLLLARRMHEARYAAAATPLLLRVVPQVERSDMSIFSMLPPEAPVEGVFPLPVPRGPGRRTTFQL